MKHAQKQHLMLNSYLPGITTLDFPKRHYENIFSEKLVNGLNEYIENHPRVIHSPNFLDSLFVKIDVTIVNKQKHILKISVRDLHSDMILPIPQGGFLGAITVDGKLCIGDTPLRKYMPKYIKTNE